MFLGKFKQFIGQILIKNRVLWQNLLFIVEWMIVKAQNRIL